MISLFDGLGVSDFHVGNLTLNSKEIEFRRDPLTTTSVETGCNSLGWPGGSSFVGVWTVGAMDLHHTCWGRPHVLFCHSILSKVILYVTSSIYMSFFITYSNVILSLSLHLFVPLTLIYSLLLIRILITLLCT